MSALAPVALPPSSAIAISSCETSGRSGAVRSNSNRSGVPLTESVTVPMLPTRVSAWMLKSGWIFVRSVNEILPAVRVNVRPAA